MENTNNPDTGEPYLKRVITVDKNQAYETGIPELIYEGVLSCKTSYRQTKYLNNIVEQDHRRIKKKTNPMLGFKSYDTAEKTKCGVEAMNMIRKGQVGGERSTLFEVEFINRIFGRIA